jgi:septation ring formation regulator EzrA
MNQPNLLLIIVCACTPLTIALILLLVRRKDVQRRYAQSVQNRIQAIKRRALVEKSSTALTGLQWELNYVQTNYILTHKQLKEVRQLKEEIQQRIS